MDIDPTCIQATDLNPQRGLWDIVWGCFVTIFACTWIAVHPNIPAPEDGWWRIMGRRIQIMGCAIIAPELVIIWAMRQWYCSRKIAKEYNNRNWTQTHGFFVQMGGFMLYKNGEEFQTLSLENIKYLHSTGRIDFPDITRSQIWDKSKGDALSKALVIFQTAWFIVQCIARGLQGMFITELEILTLGFAVLNGVMYFLWWRKPLDVECPIPVHVIPDQVNPPTSCLYEDDRLMTLILNRQAVSAMSDSDSRGIEEEGRSPCQCHCAAGHANIQNLRTVLMPNSSMNSFDNDYSELPDSYSNPGHPKSTNNPHKRRGADIPTKEKANTKTRPSDGLPLRAMPMTRNSSQSSFYDNVMTRTPSKSDPPEMAVPEAVLSSSREESERTGLVGLISSAVTSIHLFSFNALFSLLQAVSEMVGSTNGLHSDARRVPTFYAGDVISRPESLLMGSAASIIAIVFGGIHCIAWAFRFPTTVEQHLWRAGSLAITCVPIVFFSIFVLMWFADMSRPYISGLIFVAGYVENSFIS